MSEGRGQIKRGLWSSKLRVGRGTNDPTQEEITATRPWRRPSPKVGYSTSKAGGDSYRSRVIVKKRNLRGCDGLFKRHSETLNAYRMLVGRSLGGKKQTFGRSRKRWEGNLKMDHNGDTYGNGRWIELTQDFVQWRILVLAALRLIFICFEYRHQKSIPIQLFYSVNTAQSRCVL
jgi:hypothetical protein